MLSVREIIVGVVVLSGCGFKEERKKTRAQGNTADLTEEVLFNQNPFGANPELYLEAFRRALTGSSSSQDLIQALARCNCAGNHRFAMFKTTNYNRGVLPQVLVPDIREEIAKDSKLQLLLKLPAEYQDFVKELFASDEDINEEVQKGVIKKIVNALARETNLLERHPKLNFDAFSPLGVNNDRINSFSVAEIIARWQLTLSTENMWTAKPPIGGEEDHSLQLLSTMKLLSEWKYLLGMDKRSSGEVYGGMSLSATEVDSTDLRSFDPRKPGQEARFFAGSYSVNYETASSIDMVTSVHETWNNETHTLPLQDQALIWESAAMAFGRLKPSKRAAISSLFHPEHGVFPDDAHQLALTVLPSLEVFLKDSYIDEKERAVYNNARNAPFYGDEAADLSSLAVLMRALTQWIDQLKDVSNERLSEDLRDRLPKASEELKEPLRLVAQHLLEHQLTKQTDYKNLDLSSLFQVMHALSEANQLVFDSPFLAKRIELLFHHVTALVVADTERNLDQLSVIWLFDAMKSFRNQTDSNHPSPWLDDLIKILARSIAAWDGR